MWMVQPSILCTRHLLGEHGELHKFLHNWKKKHKITGRIKGNAIEPLSYKTRHDELAQEMITRSMHHNSPLQQPDFSYLPIDEQTFKVDVNLSFNLLMQRCPNCKKRSQENEK
jgi:hypothetical protein